MAEPRKVVDLIAAEVHAHRRVDIVKADAQRFRLFLVHGELRERRGNIEISRDLGELRPILDRRLDFFADLGHLLRRMAGGVQQHHGEPADPAQSRQRRRVDGDDGGLGNGKGDLFDVFHDLIDGLLPVAPILERDEKNARA